MDNKQIKSVTWLHKIVYNNKWEQISDTQEHEGISKVVCWIKTSDKAGCIMNSSRKV